MTCCFSHQQEEKSKEHEEATGKTSARGKQIKY
jgi:hypothetical protein